MRHQSENRYDKFVENKNGVNVNTLPNDYMVTLIKPMIRTMHKSNTRKRRGSIGGPTPKQKPLTTDSEFDDDTPINVRLYYEPKTSIGHAILASKESCEMSPIRSEEKNPFQFELKEMRRPQVTSESLNIRGVRLN